MTAVMTIGGRPRHLIRRRSRTPLILIAGGAVMAAAAVGLPDAVWARWVVAGVAGLTLLVVAVEDERDAVLAVVGYLISLGLLRRLVSMVQVDPGSDPLLLVAPTVAGLLCVAAVWRGALRRPTPLSTLVVTFVVMSGIAALNTADFGLRDNATGLLFWTAPVLWFAVTRLHGDRDLTRQILRVVAVVGGLSCATGLYQTLVDLPPWDREWFLTRGYAALGILGFDTLHPFGWAASASEFAQTGAAVLVICALELRDAVRTRARTAAALAMLGLVVATAAVALSAVRTAQILVALAVAVVIMASGIVRLLPALIGVVLAVVLLVAGVRALDVEGWNDTGPAGLAKRSLLGITDPFNADTSTLRSHTELTDQALRTVDDNPLGGGVAWGTQAAGRSQIPSAENDLGNAALAFGAPGVLLVVVTTAAVLYQAWRQARTRRSMEALAVLGVLVLSLRYWWAGSHYAMAVLVWLLVGHLDRPARR